MKMVCKEQEPVFSNSHTFIDLPRVGELLAGDRGKLHIPEDSSKDTATHLCRSFCLLRQGPPRTQSPVRVDGGEGLPVPRSGLCPSRSTRPPNAATAAVRDCV